MPPNNTKFGFSGLTDELNNIKQLIESLGPAVQGLVTGLTGVNTAFTNSVSNVHSGGTPAAGSLPGDQTSLAGANRAAAEMDKFTKIQEARRSGQTRSEGSDIIAMGYVGGETKQIARMPMGQYNDMALGNPATHNSASNDMANAVMSTMRTAPSNMGFQGPSQSDAFSNDAKYRMAGIGTSSADMARFVGQTSKSDNSSLESTINRLTEESKKSGDKNAETNRMTALLLRDLADEIKNTGKELKVASKEYEASRSLDISDPERQRKEKVYKDVLSYQAQKMSEADEIMGRNPPPPSGGGFGNLRQGAARGAISLAAGVAGAATVANQYLGAEQAFQGAIYNKEIESMQEQSRVAKEVFKQEMSFADMRNPRNILMAGADLLMPHADNKFIGIGGADRAMTAGFDSEKMRVDMLERQRTMGLLEGGGKAVGGVAALLAGLALGGPVGLGMAGAGLLAAGGGASSMAKGYVGNEYTALSGELDQGLTGGVGDFFFGDDYSKGARHAQIAARAKFSGNVMQKANAAREAEADKYQHTQMALGQMADLDRAQVSASSLTADAFNVDAYNAYMESHAKRTGIVHNITRRTKEMGLERERWQRRDYNLPNETPELTEEEQITAKAGRVAMGNTFTPGQYARMQEGQKRNAERLARQTSEAQERFADGEATEEDLELLGKTSKKIAASLGNVLGVGKTPDGDRFGKYTGTINHLRDMAFDPRMGAGTMRLRSMAYDDPEMFGSFMTAVTGGRKMSRTDQINKASDLLSKNSPELERMSNVMSAFHGRAAPEVMSEARRISPEATMFEALGMTPAEFSMADAQVKSVMNVQKSDNIGLQVFGSSNFDTPARRTAVPTVEAIMMSRGGFGTLGQITGNIAQIGAVTGSRGGESLDKLKQVLTSAVAAGFNGSHMAQQFVQSTLKLSDSLKLRDVEGTSRKLVRSTGLMSATGDTSDPLAMNRAVRAMANYGQYTAQRTGRQGVFKTIGAIQSGASIQALGAITSMNALEAEQAADDLDNIRSPIANENAKQQVALWKQQNRKPGENEAQLDQRARAAVQGQIRGAFKSSREEIITKLNAQGGTFSGGKNMSQMLDRFLNGGYNKEEFNETFQAVGALEKGLALGEGVGQQALLQAAKAAMPDSDFKDYADKVRARMRAGGKTSAERGQSILQKYIDKASFEMMQGNDASGNLTDVSLGEAKEIQDKLGIDVAGMSRFEASQMLGAKAADQAKYQKVFVTNFHEMHTSLVQLGGIMRRTKR